MELKLLQTFQEAARLLSFHRAAESLHYAQSTVSAQIQALEEELGVPLFDRLGRRVMLTEAGERLVDYAAKMIDLDAQARADISQGAAAGTLIVRAPESLAVHRLPWVIRHFFTLHPRVKLELTTCAHETLAADLRKGVTDLAFLLTESISEADLESEVIGYEELVLVASPGHRLAKEEMVAATDLAGCKLLLTRSDCSYRRILEDMLRAEGVKPSQVLEFNSLAALKECLAQGLGVSIMPRTSAQGLVARGRLAVLPWIEVGLETAWLMIWHKDKWLSPVLTAFMDAVRAISLADKDR